MSVSRNFTSANIVQDGRPDLEIVRSTGDKLRGWATGLATFATVGGLGLEALPRLTNMFQVAINAVAPAASQFTSNVIATTGGTALVTGLATGASIFIGMHIATGSAISKGNYRINEDDKVTPGRPLTVGDLFPSRTP